VEDRDGRHGGQVPQQWHGWGSPIGMGVGLLCVGGFFLLLALGLSVLASIG
jgi:hypothetical protein